MEKEGTNSESEKFNDGHIEFIREGKNIFVKNLLSQDEHEDYINHLAKNRLNIFAEIREMISSVVNLIDKYDKIFVLGSVSSRITNELQKSEQPEGAIEIIMEYCQSIAMATPNSNKGVMPNSTVLSEIFDLLINIRRNLQAYYGIEHLEKKFTKIEYEMRFAMIRESLGIRGEGYIQHVESLFIEMFGPHNEILENAYGFSAIDLIDTFNQLESSFTLRIASPNGKEAHPFFNLRLKQWEFQTRGKGKFPEDFAKANPGVIVEQGKVMLYPLNWIEYYDRLYKVRHFNGRQELVAKRLALKFGENGIFGEHDSYNMLNPSEIFLKPLVDDDAGNLFLFGMNLGSRNLFNIAQNLIKQADEKYYNKVFLGKSDDQSQKIISLKEKCWNYLKKCFPMYYLFQI